MLLPCDAVTVRPPGAELPTAGGKSSGPMVATILPPRPPVSDVIFSRDPVPNVICPEPSFSRMKSPRFTFAVTAEFRSRSPLVTVNLASPPAVVIAPIVRSAPAVTDTLSAVAVRIPDMDPWLADAEKPAAGARLTPEAPVKLPLPVMLTEPFGLVTVSNPELVEMVPLLFSEGALIVIPAVPVTLTRLFGTMTDPARALSVAALVNAWLLLTCRFPAVAVKVVPPAASKLPPPDIAKPDPAGLLIDNVLPPPLPLRIPVLSRMAVVAVSDPLLDTVIPLSTFNLPAEPEACSESVPVVDSDELNSSVVFVAVDIVVPAVLERLPVPLNFSPADTVEMDSDPALAERLPPRSSVPPPRLIVTLVPDILPVDKSLPVDVRAKLVPALPPTFPVMAP